MRVKVHPHRSLVDAGEEACVSITPMKKHGRAYYMGTVFLKNASFVVHDSGVQRAVREGHKNVCAWITGEVIFEATEQHPPSDEVLDKFDKVVYADGKFLIKSDDEDEEDIDVTNGAYSAGIVVGNDCYIIRGV